MSKPVCFIVLIVILGICMSHVFCDICDKFTVGNHEKKEFYSPLYPAAYNISTNCNRILLADKGFLVEVEFHEFQLEEHSNCNFDFVEVYDGRSKIDVKIGRYCGAQKPPVFASSGQALFFSFQSDGSNTFSGFRASYRMIDAASGFVAVPGIRNARNRGVEWLRRHTNASQSVRVAGSRDLAARAVIAMRLVGAAHFTQEVAEDELLAQHVQTQIAAALLAPPVSSTQLSLFVNALLASCRDPRNFFGHDLVDRLLQQVASTAGIVHPLAYLALCNAHEPLPLKAGQDLRRILNSLSHQTFLTDMRAMAVTTVACMANSNSSFKNINETRLFGDYEAILRNFGQLRNKDGSFGNVYTTALVSQALISSGWHRNSSWDIASTARFLMQEVNATDADLLTTYLTLPVFGGTSLANISSLDCPIAKNRDDTMPLVNTQHTGPKVRVQYSLFVGDERDVIHTIYLRVPANSTAQHVMILAAAEDPKYGFQWGYTSGKVYVYEISGLTNDPEIGYFWLTFVGSTNDMEAKSLEPVDTRPEKLILEEGDHLIMWYRTAGISR